MKEDDLQSLLEYERRITTALTLDVKILEDQVELLHDDIVVLNQMIKEQA